MAGRAGHRLRHHAPVQVEDSCGQITRFTYSRRERGADHRLRLLLHDGDQAVPHDLPLDLRQRAGLVSHQAVSRVSSM